MDIYEKLKNDHDKHRELLTAICDAGDNLGAREKLYRKLRDDVMAHANAEEQSFYATLMSKREGQEQARHSVHEHEQADELFEILDNTPLSSPEWMTIFKKLKHDLEHHMKEEEKDVFALAQKLIPDQASEEMKIKFEKRKSFELTETHMA